MKPKYICALSAIAAVVSLLVLASFVYPGEASYTRSPETWYWTTVQNTSYINYVAGFAMNPSDTSEEARQLGTSAAGTLLIPIYAVNPNPTLYIRGYTDTNSGHLWVFIDGRVGSKQTGNISLYGSPAVDNVIFTIPTNLTRGYSTLNLTLWQNGSQNDASISAMWLE